MGRPSKLTPDVVNQLDALIGAGCSIDDSCDQVGITKPTFYNWRKESIRLCELGDRVGNALATQDDVLFLTFFNRMVRAQSRARVIAVMAVRTGLIATEQVETVSEVYTETRFRKNEKGVEVPYEYKRTINKRIVREVPPSWQAGIEFLKRRMPEEWSDRIKIEDWHDKAIDDIRAGLIDFDKLAEEFDLDLATDLFTKAGVPIPTGKS